MRASSMPRGVPTTVAALVATLALVAACGTPAEPGASASGPVATSPAPATIAPSGAPADAGWTQAGSTLIARTDTHVVPLPGGGALVVGDSSEGWASGGSVIAEVWDPATAAWHEVEELNKPRDQFVAVALGDGRVLVAGGVNQAAASFSSAYTFDPGSETWTKVGLMTTGRAGPAAAVLEDGRVLVAGGRYSEGWQEGSDGSPVTAAVARLAEQGGGVVLASVETADVDPGIPGVALATAELFDPATGEWTRTGSMRFARVGASAVTLGDGRVLVWGSDWDEGVDARAPSTGELYDPATGSFSPAPEIPAPEALAVQATGAPLPSDDPGATDRFGSLVPLATGDALLADAGMDWDTMSVFRTLVFRVRDDAWVEVGTPYVEWWDENAEESAEFGVLHPNGVVAPLTDGRVLLAGGYGDLATAVEILDPVSATWSAAPALPSGREFAASALLPDATVLVVGGWRTVTTRTSEDVVATSETLLFATGG